MQWIEISIICQTFVVEKVTELLADFTPNGIIEEAYGDEAEQQSRLTIYGDVSKTEAEWLAEVKSILADTLIGSERVAIHQVTTKVVDANDWLNSWQQFIEPSEILPGIVIKPEWQEYTAKEGERIIEIASDLSFGTGAHETTRNCAKLAASYLMDQGLISREYKLLDAERAQDFTCLDIGTGTGILLLVAANLGLGNLCGIDIEESAAKDAIKNCEKNGVQAQIICGDLDRDYHGLADLIFANLTVDPLKLLLPAIGRKLAPQGKLIISGIIDQRYEEIMPYIQADWSIDQEVVEGPWHTFLLSAKG